MRISDIHSFSEALRSFRERTRPRISQQRLADTLDVHRQTIVAWERGDYLPKDRGFVLEIAKCLHLSDEETDVLLKAALLDIPSLPWHVPYHQNPFFTGRQEALHYLHHTLQPGTTAALTQPQAISGLGGIGKTQVALEYAYRHRQDYQAVLWLQASTSEILFSEFVKLAQVLNLPEQNEQDQTHAVNAVRRWLKGHRKWLLILDDLEDLLLLQEFLPPGHHGCVLLTTRVAVTEPVAQVSELATMTEQEGILFLLRRTKVLLGDAPLGQTLEEQRVVAKKICQLMDGLPLALDQAGAYILATGCGISSYLDLYQQRRIELLKLRGTFPSGHPESLFTTFSLAFERVEKTNRAAADLLRLCAFLHSDAIPDEIMTLGAPHLGQLLQSLVTDPLVFNEAITTLRTYSLVRRDATDKMLSIHRLVQAVFKDAMSSQMYQQWAERTVRAVSEAFPLVEFTTWFRCERCLPHVWICSELIEHATMTFPEAARLLDRTGWYLSECARYAEAEPLLLRALAIFERQLDPPYHDMAACLNNLAEVYVRQDKYTKAEPLLLRALMICGQQLGLHQVTAASLNNLADLYSKQGRYTEAEVLHKQVLALYERHVGPEDRRIARSLNNLVAIYFIQGKYAEIEPLAQRALAICEQQLGPMHPDTAHSLSMLAGFYCKEGKYAQAEPLTQRTLAILEQQLGPMHPDTASGLSSLAELYRKQGKYAQAEPLLLRALAIREKRLGPEHRETAFSLDDLAELYREEGKYAQAEPLLLRALAIWEQSGSEHPGMFSILNNLAALYHMQDKYAEAEALYQRVLPFRERQLGPEHPQTVSSLNNLAALYHAQRKYAEAEALYQRVLAIWERQLGPEHPDTVGALNNFAMLYYGQGKYEEAASLLQRDLAIWERQLGPEHPSRVKSLKNLVELYYKLGKYEEAESLLQRDLAICEQQLGPEHLHRVLALDNLAGFYLKRGKYAEAEPLAQRALAICEQQLGGEHLDTGGCLNNLAMLYFAQSRYTEAEPLAQRALAICEQQLGSTHPETVVARTNYAQLLRMLHREIEAAQFEEQLQDPPGPS